MPRRKRKDKRPRAFLLSIATESTWSRYSADLTSREVILCSDLCRSPVGLGGRVEFTSGPYRGQKLYIAGMALKRLAAAHPQYTCNCTAYRFPHRGMSGACVCAPLFARVRESGICSGCHWDYQDPAINAFACKLHADRPDLWLTSCPGLRPDGTVRPGT